MSDLVGSRATEIMSHMNKDHEDSMIAMVLHNNKRLTHPPVKAKMVSIDAKGFTIEYKYVTELMWNTSGEKRRQRVTFTPAVKTSSEVRSQVVALSKEAESSLPQTYPIIYALPRDLLIWLVLFTSLTLMTYPSALASTPPVVANFLGTLRDKVGLNTVSIIWKGLVAAHTAESLAMTYYVQSRGASLGTTAKWIFTHFFVGFPTYFAFKKINPDVPRPSKNKKSSG